MNQDDNQAVQTSRPGMSALRRPTAAESRRWLEEHVWSLPLLDERSADEILGDGMTAPGVEPGEGCTNNPGLLNWSGDQSAGGR
jgi:hypothetical protein